MERELHNGEVESDRAALLRVVRRLARRPLQECRGCDQELGRPGQQVGEAGRLRQEGSNFRLPRPLRDVH